MALARWSGSRVRRLLIALAVAGTVASLLPAAADGPRVYDSDASRDNVYGGTEPWLAVNPQNPDNIVEYYQGGLAWPQLLAGGHPSATTAPPNEADLVRHPGGGPATQWWETHCTVAYTFNAGRTWRHVDPPVYDSLYPACNDPTVTVLPDGTFLIMSEVGGPSWSLLRSAVSHDGGRSWTEVTNVTTKTQEVLATARGESVTGTHDDRPWLSVDASTGTTYVTYNHWEDPTGGTVMRRFVASLPADGEKWDGPYPIDDPDYPEPMPGGAGTIAAAHGVLAAAFVATSAPSDAVAKGQSCPCVVFETSTDGGKTWPRHTVLPPGITAADTIAADPARPGHYAIGGINGSGYDVATTTDNGKTWSKTVVAGRNGTTVNKSWLAYAPHNGAIGVFWRENETSGQNAIAAVSRDGGKTFSNLVQLNSETAPARSTPTVIFDDVSEVVMTDTDLYASWADMRGPEGNTIVQAWLGRWHYN